MSLPEVGPPRIGAIHGVCVRTSRGPRGRPRSEAGALDGGRRVPSSRPGPPSSGGGPRPGIVARGMAKLLISTARPARRRDAAKASADYGATATPDWRGVDWRAHRHELELGGARAAYVDLGAPRDESPVVFVHGLGGSWQNWLENLPAVAERRRAVALDLPGFGGSERPDRELSISVFADAVEALCDHLGLGPVAVVGNSMGGFVAAETAIRHPARVERLVLVDAAGISTTDLMRRPTRAAAKLLAAAMTGHARRSRTGGASGGPRPVSLPARPAALHAAVATVARHPTRLARDLLAEQVAGRAQEAGFLAALDAIMDYDFRGRLPEIACPTLVVQGANDMLIPAGDAETYNRLIPDSRVLLLEDTGHVPMLERPAVFNDQLLEFLAETGGHRAAPVDSVEREPAAAE